LIGFDILMNFAMTFSLYQKKLFVVVLVMTKT
jgi:hypothetical protein